MNMLFFSRFVRLFVPLALVLTLSFGVSYVNDQQILRAGADEPQVWMAADAALRLTQGVAASAIAPAVAVSIEMSPAPYLVLYDKDGKPVAGNGLLHSVLPTVPQGIFAEAKKKGEHRLSWEPEHGIRQAIVVVPVADGDWGYVLAGRSLVPAEEQESELFLRTCIGWLASLAILALVIAGMLLLAARKRDV